MADNLENPSFNFSIENTMELGSGSQQLLDDLLGSETSTESPDNVTPIVHEIEKPAPEKKPAVPKGKEVSPNEDGEDSQQSLLSDFLLTPDDDEEEEVIAGKPAKKPEIKAEDETTEDDKIVSPFTALARDLTRLGVFTQEEGEEEVVINSDREFLERFNEEKRKGAITVVNDFIARFGEDYQAAFDAIFVKGVDPREYFTTYNNIVSFIGLDLEDENNQVAVVRQMLVDQGYETEDIAGEIERYRNYGDLETVATKHHKVLVKKETAKLQQLEEQSKKELEVKASVKNQYIHNVQTILQEKVKAKEFDGIPVNPKLAAELQDFLLVDKYKTASGETLTEFDKTILELKRPENHATKVKLAMLMKIMEKDPNLSTIQKSGVSKKSDELFSEVARQSSKSKTGSSPASKDKGGSWFS